MALSDQTSGPAPVPGAARIGALDVLRGVAVLGILLMNIVSFGLYSQAYENPRADGGASGIDLAVFAATSVTVEGAMRGLLSMLFGAGIVLFHRRFEAEGRSYDAIRLHLRRMLWLLLLGMIHWALMLWAGDILFIYAVCGLLMLPLVELPARAQLGFGAALVALAAVVMVLNDRDVSAKHDAFVAAQAANLAGQPLDPAQERAIEEWQSEEAHNFPTADMVAEMEAWRSGSYLEAVDGQFSSTLSFQVGNLAYWLFTDIAPFMLLGMALLRLGVLDGRASAPACAAMALAGFGIGIPLGLYELNTMMSGDYSRLAISAASRTYQISRAAMVIGYAGLLLLLVRRGTALPVQRVLAAAGQMALTNYLMQTIICTWLFYSFGAGLGLYSALKRHQLYYLVAAIWTVQLVFTVLWLRRLRFGPVEWLWRSLTYARPQPMRR